MSNEESGGGEEKWKEIKGEKGGIKSERMKGKMKNLERQRGTEGEKERITKLLRPI